MHVAVPCWQAGYDLSGGVWRSVLGSCPNCTAITLVNACTQFNATVYLGHIYKAVPASAGSRQRDSETYCRACMYMGPAAPHALQGAESQTVDSVYLQETC